MAKIIKPLDLVSGVRQCNVECELYCPEQGDINDPCHMWVRVVTQTILELLNAGSLRERDDALKKLEALLYDQEIEVSDGKED